MDAKTAASKVKELVAKGAAFYPSMLKVSRATGLSCNVIRAAYFPGEMTPEVYDANGRRVM